MTMTMSRLRPIVTIVLNIVDIITIDAFAEVFISETVSATTTAVTATTATTATTTTAPVLQLIPTLLLFDEGQTIAFLQLFSMFVPGGVVIFVLWAYMQMGTVWVPNLIKRDPIFENYPDVHLRMLMSMYAVT